MHTQSLGHLDGAGVAPLDGVFRADRDTVVTVGRYRASVRDTGKQIDTPIVHVFTIRDGKIADWEGFSNSEHVAEAHAAKAASAR